MTNLLKILKSKGVELPSDAQSLIESCKGYKVFNSTDELLVAALGGENNNSFQVKYDVPNKGEVVEVVVHRVTNGVSANYTEPYMRRRDPGTMVVADDLPSDKTRFRDRYGYEFSTLRHETFQWMQDQELAIFFYFAGREGIGVGGLAIAPANAGFFALGLAMLQQMVPVENLTSDFKIESIIYVAPPFRHTHFNGKQVVVHNRTETLHEIFSYNLYPGPSAKKGLYGALLTKGEREGWITAHCSTVQVISPYDNVTTFMHEGASGGGKSEMLQTIVREPNGLVKVGQNLVNKEVRQISLPMFCSFNPVTDDMAICHPSLQKDNGKLSLIDAENAWFIRVDSILDYGDDPFLEKLTIKPQKPLLFLNIKSHPDSTALVWDHIEDEPGKRCPNPRVILPRDQCR